MFIVLFNDNKPFLPIFRNFEYRFLICTLIYIKPLSQVKNCKQSCQVNFLVHIFKNGNVQENRHL